MKDGLFASFHTWRHHCELSPCHSLSPLPRANAKCWMEGKKSAGWGGDFLCPNQRWCFSTSSCMSFQTVQLLIPRACDIIGNWAPALRKHAGELGRMWLKLWSACRRRAREKRVMDEHREAIVQAKSHCCGPAWGHPLGLSPNKTAMSLICPSRGRCWESTCAWIEIKQGPF